jgi:hypothetical protein
VSALCHSGLAQLAQRIVDRMLYVVLRETPHHRFGVSCPELQRAGQLDQFVGLLLNDLPVDGRVSVG